MGRGEISRAQSQPRISNPDPDQGAPQQRTTGGLVFFSFWVLLGSSGFFWCSSGVLLVFFWVLLGSSDLGVPTRGAPLPLRGCPSARALEWERWISLRWLFGDSNAVVSLRWGLGGLRHFRGALRPFRHSSRGLPTGSAIRCHSSHSCAGACDSGFADPRLLDVATARGSLGFFFVLLPRILGCWGSRWVFCARFPPREASLCS
jgi:hypothetical protein